MCFFLFLSSVWSIGQAKVLTIRECGSFSMQVDFMTVVWLSFHFTGPSHLFTLSHTLTHSLTHLLSAFPVHTPSLLLAKFHLLKASSLLPAITLHFERPCLIIISLKKLNCSAMPLKNLNPPCKARLSHSCGKERLYFVNRNHHILSWLHYSAIRDGCMLDKRWKQLEI